MYYKVRIAETGRDTPRHEPELFNEDIEVFKTLDEVKAHIVARYGKIPKRTYRNTVYCDPHEPIGFLRSFWSKDWSHDSKSWFQTDWVTVTEVTETPVLVN